MLFLLLLILLSLLLMLLSLLSMLFCITFIILPTVAVDGCCNRIVITQLLQKCKTTAPQTFQDSLRLAYCRIWKAILEGDEKGLEREAEKLGVKSRYRLLACILTGRSWSAIKSNLSTEYTSQEVGMAVWLWYILEV